MGILLNDEYEGHCWLCGKKSAFLRGHRSLREGYRCQYCGSSLRYRGQAEMIVDLFGSDGDHSLVDIASSVDFRKKKLYEPGVSGPFRSIFRDMEHYTTSFYWDDVALGDSRGGVQCQNLESLTFDDNTFDLVITSDIMEHVRKPWQAFQEIFRVLALDGIHVFSIPVQTPMPSQCFERVDTSGGKDTFLVEPHFHGDGAGGRSLVYIDYGRDIFERLAAIGYIVSMQSPRDESPEARRLLTFATRKKRAVFP